MTTQKLLAETWAWEPSVVIGCAALLVAYGAALHFRYARQVPLFVGGVLVMLFSLVSPLDTLGDIYLFSAHMLQHLLLIQVAAPLLILGLPSELARRLLDWPLAGRAERVLRRLPLAWSVGVATVWLWHVPALYNAALGNESIHSAEHLLFLVSASIYWWPILTPLLDHRPPVGRSIAYIFTGMAANALLGILLTFAALGLYPQYVHPPDPYGALSLIRNGWGLTAETDQQIGGLLMWVPGSLVYLAALLGVLTRWYREPEEDTAWQGIEPGSR